MVEYCMVYNAVHSTNVSTHITYTKLGGIYAQKQFYAPCIRYRRLSG